MAKRDVFIGFDFNNDRHYKNVLVAWDKNEHFDITFFDKSVTVPVNSTNADSIRRVISQRIAACPRFLCIVGQLTYKSDCVIWEIDKAIELNRRIIAVKTNRLNTSPAHLFIIGAD